MIKLFRDRHKTAIPAGLRGVKRKDKELLLLRGKRDGTLSFDSSLWKPAKKQLKKETHNKCAYCEANTAVVAHGDVEHFRPKTIYWWLAYSYENYLFSCQICNQIYKSDNFPISGVLLPAPVFDPQADDNALSLLAGSLAPDPFQDNDGLPAAQFLQQMNLEKALLVNPYFFDPADFFKWEEDEVLKEVRLGPLDNTPEAISVAQAAIDFLGINREELCNLRWKEYEKAKIFKDVLIDGNVSTALLQDIKHAIKDMMADDASFAGMIRYYVNKVWGLDLD